MDNGFRGRRGDFVCNSRGQLLWMCFVWIFYLEWGGLRIIEWLRLFRLEERAGVKYEIIGNIWRCGRIMW